MNFLELAEKRYSVRSFKDKPVDEASLKKILRAGYVAPTGCNNQPQRILVLNTAASMARLRNCTKCHFGAPTALLVCYDKTECWYRSYDGQASGAIDASIVATHMMLEAADIGIGSTWVMYFDPEAIRKEFAVPENIEPVALLVMGYPATDARPYPGHNEFRPEEQLIKYEQF